MAKFVLFCGLRYNLDKVRHPARVLVPPCETISPTLQTSLYPFGLRNLLLCLRGIFSPRHPFFTIACIPGRLSSHANIRT